MNSDLKYSQENYQEDTKLILFTIRKYFYKYPEIKEELISEGYIGIMRAYKEYQEDRGMNLATFKIMLCRQRMGLFLRRYYKTYRKENGLNTTQLSLSNTYGADEDTLLSDLLPDTSVDVEKEAESNYDYDIINNLLYKTLESMKTYARSSGKLLSPKLYKIIPIYLENFSYSKTARICNTTKQYVETCVKKYREKLKRALADYEIIA